MPGWSSVVMGIVVAGVTVGNALNFLNLNFSRESRDPSVGVLLKELISGPLRGRDVFLLQYKPFQYAMPRDTATVLLTTYEDFVMEQYPTHYLRGPNYVVIFLFSRPPTSFLQYLALSGAWNPSYLLLINTNASQSTVALLDHRVVQRSRHVVLLEAFVRNVTPIFTLQTSFPFRSTRPRAAMGHWNETHYKSMADLFLDRHPSMEGAVLSLGSWCDDYPFIYIRGNYCVGSNLDTLSLIAAKLNFSYDVQRETKDQKWGELEEGRWTGMLGDLVYNNKHLVINLVLVTYERWRDFDITYPYHAEGFGFLAGLPPPVSQWRSITYPFSRHLWLTVIASTIIVSSLSPVLSSIVAKEPIDYIKHILMVGGGVARQGALQEERRWLAGWWLSCIILTTAYTSNLIAFLTVPLYPSRIETVLQLAQSHYRVTMQDYGNYVPSALKQSSEQSLAALGKKIDLFPLQMGYDPGIRDVLRGTHFLIETYSYLIILQMENNLTSQTYIMKEQVYSGQVSWFLPKNTPYTHKVSSLLTKLREAGLITKFYLEHFPHTADGNEKLKTRRLSMEQLQGAFLLLLLAQVASCASFATELVWNKKMRETKTFVEQQQDP